MMCIPRNPATTASRPTSRKPRRRAAAAWLMKAPAIAFSLRVAVSDVRQVKATGWRWPGRHRAAACRRFPVRIGRCRAAALRPQCVCRQAVMPCTGRPRERTFTKGGLIMMDGWYGNGWGIGAWVAMALMMLIFWGGVVTVVVLLVRRPHPGEGAGA